MKRFKLVLLVAALTLPVSSTLWVGETVAEEDADEDMFSREEVQLMIDEAVRKVPRNVVHNKQLVAQNRERDERLKERFEEQNEPNGGSAENFVTIEWVDQRLQWVREQANADRDRCDHYYANSNQHTSDLKRNFLDHTHDYDKLRH